VNGRYVDKCFVRASNKDMKLNPKNYHQKQCIMAFEKLKTEGIRIVRIKKLKGCQQFPVCIPEIRLKTELDGVGVDDRGRVVVIELKTTTHSMAVHNSRYTNECKNLKQLKHVRLPNNEKTAHFLQTGFGVLGLRRRFPGLTVRGVVVFAANNEACVYNIPESYTRISNFNQGTIDTYFPRKKKKPVVKKTVVCGKKSTPRTKKTTIIGGTNSADRRISFEPIDKSIERDVLKVLKTYKYTKIIKRLKKFGSFVAQSPTSLLVVGLIYNPYGEISKHKKQQLIDDCGALWVRQKRNHVVKACILAYGQGETNSMFHNIEFLPDATKTSK
jgi:hypothetical protein